ncbi:tRNA (cytosine(34)-C(5))-methyltransferase, mitochondrial [Merluccius polli]|uniref:tRNA (Cytosine(34)-C(5))-methyltransferase, mitochondrial n=1 Tax=Merluccius polli TaxID=89951 RepID=A0AA47P2N1_MERPO|nr:tRNA (cytosine(34)-C(5))-methyltransferase, mitochondrial [Merluccius polli]
MLKRLISVQTLHSMRSVTLRTTYFITQIRSCSSNSDTVPTQQQPAAHKTPKGLKEKKKKGNVVKTRRQLCQPVLDSFDEQYGRELANIWPSARSVLLDPDSWQYGVMLNRFAALSDIINILQSKGFSSFLPQTHAPFLPNKSSSAIPLPRQHGGVGDAAESLSKVVSPDAHRTGPNPHTVLEASTQRPLTDTLANSSSLLSTTSSFPSSSSSPFSPSSSSPSSTISYSPTTSSLFSSSPSSSPSIYSSASSSLPSSPSSSMPNSSSSPSLSLLQCFLHPKPVHLPSQAHWPGVLKQYYLLNAASLLPVLALQLRDGEKVLDLCSAPGGKALAIMQTANPALLCCNESDPHRKEWLAQTLESFLPQSLSNRVILSNQDGRVFGLSPAGTYDKVLVDAPCSNDRSWLYSSSPQQGAQRLKDRATLPSLQAQLLRSALGAVRPGGAVVYSTCTLSTYENAEVVGAVLDSCPEAELEDLWEELATPFSAHFTFIHPPQHRHHQRRRCGLLVVPTPGRTWGPMYLCRIRRRG